MIDIKNKLRRVLLHIIAYIVVYALPIWLLMFLVFTYMPIFLVTYILIMVAGGYYFIEYLIIFRDCEDISDFFKATGCLTLVVIQAFLCPVIFKYVLVYYGGGI